MSDECPWMPVRMSFGVRDKLVSDPSPALDGSAGLAWNGSIFYLRVCQVGLQSELITLFVNSHS